jgi:hypothetical protein
MLIVLGACDPAATHKTNCTLVEYGIGVFFLMGDEFVSTTKLVYQVLVVKTGN